MLEGVNAVSDDPGGTQDSDRIDALLSTALADQARERRTLVETVLGAKAALVKAEEEIAGLRELIDKRDDALLEAVAKGSEGLADSIVSRVEAAIRAQPKPKIAPPRDAGLTLRIDAIEEGILQIAQRIAELPSLVRRETEELALAFRRDLDEVSSQLRRDLEVSALAIGDRIGEESASLLADLREDQVEVVQTLASMSEASAREVREAVSRQQQELMDRITNTGRDTIEAGQSSVEQMVEHLTGYLQARDEQLYRARDQRLVELFQHLSDTIGRTTRRKLGKILEDGPPPQPMAPPLPPVKAPPPLSIPRTFRQPPREEPAGPGPFAGPQGADTVVGGPETGFAGASHNRLSVGDDVPPFEDVPEPPFARPEPPFGRPEPPRVVRVDPTFPKAEPPGPRPNTSPAQSLGNPLTRAELVRDYLIQSPSEIFVEEPPAAPAAKGRKAGASAAKPEDKRRSPRAPAKPPKPPASPRTRRKI